MDLNLLVQLVPQLSAENQAVLLAHLLASCIAAAINNLIQESQDLPPIDCLNALDFATSYVAAIGHPTLRVTLHLDAALLPEVLMYKGQAGEASKEYVSEKLMSTLWLHFIVHAGLEAADDWASTDLGVPLNCCLEQQWKPT